MFIECVKSGRAASLRVSETYSVWVGDERKVKKRCIRYIGQLSKFDDGKENYVQRLKESFKEGNPLIGELKELSQKGLTSDEVTIKFSRKNSKECEREDKNIGYFLLEKMFSDFQISYLLNMEKSRSKIKYDILGLIKLLIYGRVLKPCSKVSTFKQANDYLFPPTKDKSEKNIFRVLNVLDKKSESIQSKIDKKISESIGRNKDICFYDVTNYFFEIDDNDEDILIGDDGALEGARNTGNVANKGGQILEEGLRKSGPSKAKNRKPIVQMGLFIDDNNIPISYKLFPGNHIDQTTLRPTLKKTINKMGYDRVIIVGDGGVNSGKNIAHIVGEGDGYILSKSTRRANKKEKEWILDDSGFRWTGKDKAFKIKSEIREREVLDENGNKRVIKEKFITYWSKKHYKYECKENRKFIEYLDAVCDFPDKLKDKENKLNKYLKKTNVVKGTGEVVKTKVRYTLDKEKLERDLSLMGYYNLMTSEVKMPDEEVIKKYKGLSKIENSFRVIKSDLEGRPVYVRTASHINAHFLICFIALTMIRIIQHKVLKYQGKKTNRLAKWEEGLSANKIKEALNNFTATRLPGDYFMVSQKSEDLSLILKSFNLEKPINLPSLEMLRQYRFNIKK